MTENQIHIGGLKLKVLSDGILEFDPCVFFPSTNEDDWIPHKSHLNHNSNVVFDITPNQLKDTEEVKKDKLKLYKTIMPIEDPHNK